MLKLFLKTQTSEKLDIALPLFLDNIGTTGKG